MSDFNVRISYKNKNLEDIGDRTYEFGQYTEMIKLELMRILMDIEDSFYKLQEGKSKEDWSEDVQKDFQKIRHKILDQANAIERLPKNTYYKDVPFQSISASKMLADFIEENYKQ